jgi:hypothetical protein
MQHQALQPNLSTSDRAVRGDRNFADRWTDLPCQASTTIGIWSTPSAAARTPKPPTWLRQNADQVGTEGQIAPRAGKKQPTKTDACDLAGSQQRIVFVVHIPSPGWVQRPTQTRAALSVHSHVRSNCRRPFQVSP